LWLTQLEQAAPSCLKPSPWPHPLFGVAVPSRQK
jgi:hypothetical protein